MATEDNILDWVKISNNGRSYYWCTSTDQTTLNLPSPLASKVQKGLVSLKEHIVQDHWDDGFDDSASSTNSSTFSNHVAAGFDHDDDNEGNTQSEGEDDVEEDEEEQEEHDGDDDQQQQQMTEQKIDGKENNSPSNSSHDRKSMRKDWQKIKDNHGSIYFWNANTDQVCWSLPKPESENTAINDPAGLSDTDSTTASPPAISSGKSLKPDGSTKSKTNASSSSSSSSTTSTATAAASATAGKSSRRGRFFGGNKERHGKIQGDIKRKVKQGKGKLDVEDVVRDMAIGAPFGVEHRLHVRFDSKNIRFSGLPAEWIEKDAQRQFGLPLAEMPRLGVEGYRDRIPAVLILLKQAFIELDGLTQEGIFRTAPDNTECEEVKQKINQSMGLQGLKDCRDPSIPANLIKQFFRELKPNLLNCLNRDQIMEYAEISNDLSQVSSKVISLIKEPHQSVLLWLLDLLAQVAEHKDTNLMTAKNLAIVMSPNLYDITNCPPMEALVLSRKLAIFLENLLDWRIQYHQAGLSSPTSKARSDTDTLL